MTKYLCEDCQEITNSEMYGCYEHPNIDNAYICEDCHRVHQNDLEPVRRFNELD